jgi:ribonuclease HII
MRDPSGDTASESPAPSLLTFERRYWRDGIQRVAGVDEAGRGPLAGPVVAAAVVLDPAFAEAEEHGKLEGLTDSKQLTRLRREAFFRLLDACDGVQIGVGAADVDEIDSLNILHATHRAMVRAVEALPVPPDFVLVDGHGVEEIPGPSRGIIRGDSRSLSIAAASVIAKVVRDRRMRELDLIYPQYGFSRHKGYGSQAHMQALFEFGPSPIHRRSFRPVREAAAIHDPTPPRTCPHCPAATSAKLAHPPRL